MESQTTIAEILPNKNVIDRLNTKEILHVLNLFRDFYIFNHLGLVGNVDALITLFEIDPDKAEFETFQLAEIGYDNLWANFVGVEDAGVQPIIPLSEVPIAQAFLLRVSKKFSELYRHKFRGETLIQKTFRKLKRLVKEG